MNIKLATIVLYLLLKHCSYTICYTVTCDFEIDECNWTLDSYWKVYASGSTPDTASSGPIADHTTGNGNYARFMAYSLPETIPYGIMNTSIYLDNSTILSFWYFMHGSQIGTLAILVNDVPVWEKSGRQGIPAWYHATVTLLPDNNVKIAFVANRTGVGRSSDIAIDDILLCGEQMPISTRTPRPPSTTTPRPRSNASCDFDVEKELCGWKSDTKYGWKVIHQRDPDVTIGPSSDYSSIRRATVDGKVCQIPYEELNVQYYYCIPNKAILQCKGSDNKFFNCRDGGFVQIRTNEFDEVGERSQFDSPVLNATSEEGCVQFQYNIVGSDDDWLSVYVEDYWTNNQVCVWHMNVTSVPDQWMTAEARLPLEQDGKYKIVFEAGKGTAGGLGLVSLDHIVISSTRCSGGYPVIQCPVEKPTTIRSTTVSRSTTRIDTTTSTVSDVCTPLASETTTLIDTTLTTTATTATTTTTTTVGTSTDITMTTDTTHDDGDNKPTSTASPGKDSPIPAIIGGVVGGVVVVSILVALFIWRDPLLSRLGVKRPTRVSVTPTYKSTSGGIVELNGGKDDQTRLV
ncbi:unnamed protein product [Adineta steineri]|uniref:MAM domain-containing protein n=1 Tax=Adineta steineri TaxID=433720 RepID=A0A818LKC2_9BILA|nr:unnamed protein product [Adineta steineri]